MVNPPRFSRFPGIAPPPTGRGFDNLGLSGSFVLVALLLGPASAELELLALIDEDVSLRELVLNVLVLVLLFPALFPLEPLFPTLPLLFAFSLLLNNLNLSNIEFCLLPGIFDL
jgi:hypothetical protein